MIGVSLQQKEILWKQIQSLSQLIRATDAALTACITAYLAAPPGVAGFQSFPLGRFWVHALVAIAAASTFLRAAHPSRPDVGRAQARGLQHDSFPGWSKRLSSSGALGQSVHLGESKQRLPHPYFERRRSQTERRIAYRR